MKIGDRLPIKKSICPICGLVQERAIVAGGQLDRSQNCPKPGDPGLCSGCGELLIVADDLTLRLADLNDALRIPPEISREMDAKQKEIRRNR